MQVSFEQKLMKIAQRLIEDDHREKERIGVRDIEQKYLKHAFQHDYVRTPDIRHRVMDNPVCGKCERIALRDRKPHEPKGMAHCPFCGWRGVSTKTARMYVKEV